MPMSAEERDLLELQTQLLRQSVDATTAGNNLNAILMPILLEQQGYTVNRATKNVLNPEYAATKKKYDKVREFVKANEQYFARDESGNLRLSKKGRGVAGLDKAMGGKLNTTISEFNSVSKKLRGLDQYTQRTGDILGLEQTADPSRDLRKENEQLLLERQNAALRGELPVSPALLSDLDQQEADLREALMQNLGTGFETSTPGIEALAKFGEHKNAILEATRRDDIASAGNFANQMGGFLEGMNAGQFGRTTAAGQLPFMGSNNLLNIVNGANGPLQFGYNNRALDAQIAAQNNGPSGLEALLYQGAGTASTFGLGKLFGVFD